MSYAFCFGPSGAGKSRFLRRFLIDRAQASLGAGGGDRTKYIMVVPEQYSMQTQRDLVQDHPAGVLMNIDVLSFGRLAHRVFEETGEDARGRILGSLEKKDELICRGKLARAGLERSGHA